VLFIKDKVKLRKRIMPDIVCKRFNSLKVSDCREKITCAHDSCKHPALSILDWPETRVGPLFQDVTAPCPAAGMDTFSEYI